MFDGNKRALAMVVLIKFFIYGGTHLMAEANGKKIADIYWNTSSPIFYIDNDMHIFVVRIRDSVDVICPKYRPGYPEERMEYSILYLVDMHSYETCTIDMKIAQVFGICSRPRTEQIITVVFREFSPKPGGLEFRPNRTYYVISTSDGSKSGLNNDRGGLCSVYNMRLKFIVKPRCRTHSASVLDDSRQEDEDCSDEEKKARLFPRLPIGGPAAPLWEVDAEDQLPLPPPQFPHRPFIWPKNSPPSGLLPRDHPRRPEGLPRSSNASSTSRISPIWTLLSLAMISCLSLLVRRRF